MKKTDNAVNIITAMTFKGIGNAWIANNLSDISTEEEIVIKLKTKLKDITIDLFRKEKENIKFELNTLYKNIGGFCVTAIGDDNFPKYKGIVKSADIPVVLFYKGDLSLLNNLDKNIAVIGLLTPDERIEQFERMLVSGLVAKGKNIVSGLALGCDSIAHSETLKNGGKTIAILPSPLSNILPKTNIPLANEILDKGGLLITEYYRDVSSKYELSSRYVRRDRLQALFSSCVILSASYAENDLGNDCGSRHAMNYAKDYGIKRAVVYNEDTDYDNPMFDLCRNIKNEDNTVVVINRINKDTIIDEI